MLYQHQWAKSQNISENRTPMCLTFISTVHNFLTIHIILLFSELSIIILAGFLVDLSALT